MAGKKPDYAVYVTRENNGETFYTRIGSAWRVRNDGISLRLDALPVTGEAVLFPPREREQEDGA